MVIEPAVLLAAMGIAGAVFFLVAGLSGARGRNQRRMATRLAHQGSAGSPQSAGESPGKGSSALRREDRLDRRLGDVPLLGSWRKDLRLSGLPWRMSDYLTMVLLIGAACGTLTFIVSGSSAAGLGGFVLGGMLPVVFVKRKVARRSAQLSGQVVDALDLLAASLKAGFGFIQSLELAAGEQADPLEGELRLSLREMNLGISVDEALERLVERTGDIDLDLVVTAVLIQRRVGGNLAEVLGNISHTIRERMRVRGEIQTLTAQARMSSWIIGLLPPGLAVVMTAMQPAYMSVLWTDAMGRMLVMIAIALELIGFYLVRRIAQISY